MSILQNLHLISAYSAISGNQETQLPAREVQSGHGVNPVSASGGSNLFGQMLMAELLSLSEEKQASRRKA